MDRVVASIALAALVAAGCSDRGSPTPMQVVNLTDHPADITIIGQADTFDQLPMTVPGGGMSLLVDVFLVDGGCIRRTLIATEGGIEISRTDRPCPGSRWEIVPRVVAPAPSS